MLSPAQASSASNDVARGGVRPAVEEADHLGEAGGRAQGGEAVLHLARAHVAGRGDGLGVEVAGVDHLAEEAGLGEVDGAGQVDQRGHLVGVERAPDGGEGAAHAVAEDAHAGRARGAAHGAHGAAEPVEHVGPGEVAVLVLGDAPVEAEGVDARAAERVGHARAAAQVEHVPAVDHRRDEEQRQPRALLFRRAPEPVERRSTVAVERVLRRGRELHGQPWGVRSSAALRVASRVSLRHSAESWPK